MKQLHPTVLNGGCAGLKIQLLGHDFEPALGLNRVTGLLSASEQQGLASDPEDCNNRCRRIFGLPSKRPCRLGTEDAARRDAPKDHILGFVPVVVAGTGPAEAPRTRDPSSAKTPFAGLVHLQSSAAELMTAL